MKKNLPREILNGLADYMKVQYQINIEKRPFKFKKEVEPKIGEFCILFLNNALYFCKKTSQNWYLSGNLRIRTDKELDQIVVMTLREIK